MFVPAVQLAAMAAHGTAVLELLLEAVPDLMSVYEYPEFSECRPVNSAARAGNSEAIRLLLQVAPQMASASDERHTVPLHEAVLSGSPEAVRLLLKAAPQTAAAFNAEGLLPMHLAACGGSVECIRLLIDAGAPGLDVPTERFKHLPLHCAAGDDHEAAVRFLLACHPAAATAVDRRGRRPLHLALNRLDFSQASLNVACALLPVSGLSAVAAAGPPCLRACSSAACAAAICRHRRAHAPDP